MKLNAIITMSAISIGLFLVSCNKADAEATPAVANSADAGNEIAKPNQKDTPKAEEPASTKLNGFDSSPAVGTKAVCPVMKNAFTVSESTQISEHNGKFYAFCCPGCKPQFDADPQKYL